MQIYHHIIMKLKRSKNKGCSININNKSVGFDEPALGYLRILCWVEGIPKCYSGIILIIVRTLVLFPE